MPANPSSKPRDGNLDLADVLGIDPDKPGISGFVDLTEEDKQIEVVDTDGVVIGVIDLTRNWIRL